MARQAIRNVPCVIGILRRSPPISRMSLVCTAWITLPAPRKSSALKQACVARWKSEAVNPSGCSIRATPSASIM